jgi:hypothetical protein
VEQGGGETRWPLSGSCVVVTSHVNAEVTLWSTANYVDNSGAVENGKLGQLRKSLE